MDYSAIEAIYLAVDNLEIKSITSAESVLVTKSM
jgi:hypothetical protein